VGAGVLGHLFNNLAIAIWGCDLALHLFGGSVRSSSTSSKSSSQGPCRFFPPARSLSGRHR
jgi:hypothetical protein